MKKTDGKGNGIVKGYIRKAIKERKKKGKCFVFIKAF